MKKFLKAIVASVVAVTTIASCSLANIAFAADPALPTRDEVIADLQKANDYWIATHPVPGRAFWDEAAYFTGNMEAYYITGIEAYKDYAVQWAQKNNWMGATSNNPAEWKYGYTEGPEGVLFGDWQICFQTYIDLYFLDEPDKRDEKKVARAKQVMDYETNTDFNGYWWWADGLYMVMPVMTRMYLLTGEDKYLEKLHEYYLFAKDSFYDDEYKLFYRDGKYVYPNWKTPSGGKDFWARGDGWVFAGLSKVLQDMPTNCPYRETFLTDYRNMAETLAKWQQPDGYWTRSIIEPDYVPGPETSGTAFFTYGFAYGINSGYLDRDKYINVVAKGWNYLSKTAMNAQGKVGYVQPIGAQAVPGQYIDANSTANFGVGAFLLAAAEVSKLVGGVQGDIYPYLTRKMVGSVALKVDTPYVYSDHKLGYIREDDPSVKAYIKDGRTLVPVRVISERLGADVNFDEASRTVIVQKLDKRIDIRMPLDSNNYTVNGEIKTLDVKPEVVNGTTFIPIRAMSEALGKEVYWNDGLIVIGHKADPFYECDKGLVDMLKAMLDTGKLPQRPEQPKKTFEIPDIPRHASYLKPVEVTVSAEPEAQNNKRNATDGDPATRWAAQGKNQWLQLDFGEVKTLAKYGIYFWRTPERSYYYKVEYSADGKTWTTIYDGQSPIGPEKMLYSTLPKPVQARYVKVTMNGNTQNDWNNINEIECYSSAEGGGESTVESTTGTTTTTTTPSTSKEPISKTAASTPVGTKTTISSFKVTAEPEPQNPGKNAVDGDTNTVWASQGTNNIVLDLGSVKPIACVGVAFKKYDDSRTIKYDVEISEDGNKWIMVYTGTSVPGGAFEYAYANGTNARYVRVTAYGNTVSGWNSIAEVQVYTK